MRQLEVQCPPWMEKLASGAARETVNGSQIYDQGYLRE